MAVRNQSCPQCGSPLDHSGDQFSLPPIESDGSWYCGAGCAQSADERPIVGEAPREAAVSWALRRAIERGDSIL